MRERWSSSSEEPQEKMARPRLCPSCGTLVGSSANRCHQCGASMTYSLAAASKSLSRLLPATSPATYAILSLSCLLYGVSLLLTLKRGGGFNASGGIFSSLMNFGGIEGQVLARLGASAPMPYDFFEPWRLVTAVFLHGSLLHIGFNMWVLMDIGPLIEELYGSARYLFLYVLTGVAGYLLSSFLGHFSVGGSGALLGLIGALLAVTSRRGGAALQMLRSNLIRWLIYIAIMGFMFSGIDNAAHLGGCIAGFLFGRVASAQLPATPGEQKFAQVLGWGAASIIVISLGFMLVQYFHTA